MTDALRNELDVRSGATNREVDEVISILDAEISDQQKRRAAFEQMGVDDAVRSINETISILLRVAGNMRGRHRNDA